MNSGRFHSKRWSPCRNSPAGSVSKTVLYSAFGVVKTTCVGRANSKTMRSGRLPEGSFPLLREALLAGEFERGLAPSLTGYKERMARTVVSKLLDALVRVKNASKRLKRPQILEVAQFFEMLKHLAEPYRSARDFASAKSWACNGVTSISKPTPSWFSAALSAEG
jgi:hypothetical protein